MGLTPHLSSWNLTLVSGVTYSVSRFAIKFTANGKNTAQLDMAVGNNTKTAGAQNFALRRGQEASVRITNVDDVTGALKGGKVFQGYVLDTSPSTIQYGAYGYTITLQGISSYLAGGTQQNSNLIPSTYLDNSPPLFLTAVDGGVIDATVGTGQVDAADAFTNGFLTPLRKAMVAIAEGDDPSPNAITAQLRLLFNSETNKPAAKILRGLSGDGGGGTITFTSGYPTGGSNSGTGLVFRTQTGAAQLCNGVCLRVSDLMRTDWKYASFYDKLLSVGGGLMFSILETSEKIWCVPHIPFFPTNRVRKIITADQYSDIAFDNQPPIPVISGCALMNTAGTQANTSGDALIRSMYKRANVVSTTYNPGQVIVASMPPLLAMAPYSGAAGSSAGPAVNHDMTGDIPDVTSDELAKLIAWSAAYKPFTIIVTCPYLRDDIAPLTAVRVDFPASAEISASMSSPAVYGVVQSVTLRGDAGQQFAQTQIEIAYVRSYNQQNTEINSDYNGHPIWSRNWYGCDLYGDDVETGF